MSVDNWDLTNKVRQHKNRVETISTLIDELHEDNYLQNYLDFPEGIALDLDKLVISGHSFGGTTAVDIANTDNRVKACVVLDPWLYPIYKEVELDQFTLQKG